MPPVDDPISAVRAPELPASEHRAQARPTPRRRPLRLRQPNNSSSRLRRRRTRNLQPATAMATGSRRSKWLRRQHRRPYGALDQRPLGLHPASRRKSPARFERLNAPPIRSLLPPAQLGRRNHVHPHLPGPRRKTKVSASPLRRIPNAKVPQHSETRRRRPVVLAPPCARSL